MLLAAAEPDRPTGTKVVCSTELEVVVKVLEAMEVGERVEGHTEEKAESRDRKGYSV